jgi:hypothetical protein
MPVQLLYQESRAMQAIPYSDVLVEEKIGGGGVGLVHRGVYKRQPVAIKILVSLQPLHSLTRTACVCLPSVATDVHALYCFSGCAGVS